MRSKLLLRTALATWPMVPIAAAIAAPAHAQEAPRRYDIPAQPLGAALVEFSRQSEVVITAPSELTKGRTGSALRGAMAVDQALARLLKGTGLTARATGAQTYALFPLERDSAGKEAEHVSSSGESGRIDSASSSGDCVGEDCKGRSEILVVGSRSLNVDVVRTQDDPQPYSVITSAEIAKSGAVTVDDFLKTRFGANAQRYTNQQDGVAGNESSVGRFNLRGLGTGQTLVLVDGRRIASAADGNELQQGNLSGIPLSAIERIEILPSTASAIFGGGATGGVINVILKRKYTGFDVEAAAGLTTRGDAARMQLSGNRGFSLEDGRTNVMLGAAYLNQKPLLAASRSFLRRSTNLLLANNPSAASLPYFFGNTANIASADGGTLILDDGRSLGSSYTFVPQGYSGLVSDNGAALVRNAGSISSDDPAEILLLGTETASGSLNIRREMTSWLDLFVDLYRDRIRTYAFPGGQQRLYLAGNAPENPFQGDILLNVPVTDLKLRLANRQDNFRARTGAILRFAHGWSSALEYSLSTSTSRANQPLIAGVLPDREATVIDAALRGEDLDGSNFYIGSSDFGPAKTTLKDASLRVSGPLVRLPGGSLVFSGLAEHRSERVGQIFYEFSFPPGDPFLLWYPSAQQHVTSLYGEVRAPLISPGNALPFIYSLEVTGSVRSDWYESAADPSTYHVVASADGPFPAVTRARQSFNSTDYTISAKYAPTPDLAIRASYATGFLAPALYQIGTQVSVNPASLYTQSYTNKDGSPLTGDANGNLTLLQGGNPNLRPERSRSLSVGLILTPRAVPNLRLSADFTRIRKTDEISTLNAQFFINNEEAFPGRIVRASGGTGPIVSIDASALNIASSKIKALDFRADYASNLGGGQLSLYATATHNISLTRDLVVVPIFDNVGFYDGVLPWKANFGADWSRGRLGLGWNTQFYDSYSIRFADPSAAGSYNDLRVLNQGKSRIPAQFYSDAYLRYRLGGNDSASSGIEMMVSIQNLFDKIPPILARSSGFYSQHGDPRLRRVLISARKHF